ncbi:hypothetical protein H8B06_18660 [Sphingobacterium sp. DN00404]|uniref:Uncharacterized protein n=1 Tax=Sphingobacterium micropteri TaxID=2763501 RepID=A0ABR7YUC7_9SPHI|nr:hypothetical protein [Sphingobacterium micropteri]MBD1434852.1 hypothetical protein [Sphingobacterium micropteri]
MQKDKEDLQAEKDELLRRIAVLDTEIQNTPEKKELTEQGKEAIESFRKSNEQYRGKNRI